MTKPVHPRQAITIVGGPKPKRIRRTKAEMSKARQLAKLKTMWAALLPLAEARLAHVSPAEKGAATRAINKIIRTGAGYNPKRGI